jgi:hypothetical protein
MRHFLLCLEIGWKFAFETNFYKFDHCNNPSLSFHYCTLCILLRCGFWAIKRRDTFYPMLRYARKRLSWKSPLTSPKWGVFWITPLWDETYRWDPRKAHPWPKLRRLIYNIWDSSARGRLCACPRSHRKKTPPGDNFTHMGSRDPPADHYELWPT